MPNELEPAQAPTIEFRFLSGAAVGERRYAHGVHVLLGAEPGCDVQVPPEDCAPLDRCQVQIQSSPAGWQLRNLGTTTVAVNHAIVAGEMRLKSGDVIRLSLSGPDVMFSVMSAPVPAASMGPATAAATPIATADRARTLLYAGVGILALALVLMMGMLTLMMYWMISNRDPRVVASSDLTVDPIARQNADEGRPWQLNVARYVASSAPDTYSFRPVGEFPAGMRLDEPTGTVTWTPSETQGPGTYAVQIQVVSRTTGETAMAALTIDVRDVDPAPRPELVDPSTAQAPEKIAVPETLTPPVPPAVEPQPRTPEAPRGAAALYLLAVEESTSGTVFPFAMGFAVRDDLLLTSGAVVHELLKARQKGRGVFAIHCASNTQAEIAVFYLHPHFTRLQDRPAEQLYCDVGALRLTAGNPTAAPLVAAGAAAPLEQGAPLECVMPVFEPEPLTRFNDIAPKGHAAKIYVVTQSGDTSVSQEMRSRLLAVVGELPKNAFGSPLIDAQGRAAAVYVEKADLTQEPSLQHLADRYHYALSLDAVAGLLDNDGLAAWRLEAPAAGDGTAPEKQQ